MKGKLQHLAAQLEASQQALSTLLHRVAGQQDWQPDSENWSFRYHAAHMATAEKEAFWERVTRIAAGNQPYFAYYLNTGRDFSRTDLLASLEQWATQRQQLLDFVRALPPEKLALTGTHETAGTITILDVLQVMLDHDLEHYQELEPRVAQLTNPERES